MKYLLFLFPFVFAGCGTVDVESQVKNRTVSSFLNPDSEDNTRKEDVDGEAVLIEDTVITLRPEAVIIEKPVYVPAEKATPEPPPPPLSGRNAAAAANISGTKAPSAIDFTAAAVVYDYHPDWVYEVYSSPSRVTDICLEENETPLEAPFVSDSERWILGGGKNKSGDSSVSHIYVKPRERGLTASMVINTDKRSYHILLRSYEETYMPIVRWQYKLYFPNDFFAPRRNQGNAADAAPPVEISKEITEVDPRFLSFDYRIMYSLWSKPRWTPRLVYDDGKKTYITFNDIILQNEFPAIFENRNDVVNYRVSTNLIIIDKLIEKITVRLGKQKIIIEKKSKQG
jgi:type IV secretion system protein VirB9